MDDLKSALARKVTQAEFAELIGVSPAKVSQLKSEGVLSSGATAGEWLGQYIARLRGQAAGRVGAGGDDGDAPDLVRERALLAREQRTGQQIKNLIAMKKFAPVDVMSEAVARVCKAITDRLDHIPASLKRASPDLPDEVFDVVESAVNSARNAAAAAAMRGLFDDELDEGDRPITEADDIVGNPGE